MSAPITFRWKMTIKRPVRSLIKHIDIVMRELLGEVGLMWHKKMRPKHFTEAGAKEYRYKSITKPYKARKERLHQMGVFAERPAPMVFSGDLRRSSERVTIKASSKRVRVMMRLRLFGKTAKRLAAQLKKVSRREAEKIRGFIQREIFGRVRALEAKEPTKTITL